MTEKTSYAAEEQYIQDECGEINVGERSYFDKLFELFPVLLNKNYQYYFVGQLISLIGSWLQIVAEGWLVLTLTNSAFLIGLVTALASVPTLLFSLFGGVIIDRFPKKKILFFTQIASMILALLYGLLTVFHFINIPEICILAFLLGTVNALDFPARQAFVPEMVDKDQLPSAIALNSAMFNAARVVGPGVAGILIAIVGTGGSFIINGLSYIAAIVALWAMNVQPVVAKKHLHPIAAIKQGLRYSFTHPIIRVLLIFAGVVSIFGWSYTTVMPYIAQHTYHVGAAGLGYLYVATGLGALCATVIISLVRGKISSMTLIVGGNTLFAISIILFTFTQQIEVAYITLFAAGLGLITQFATLNTTIQQLVSDEIRGRVISIYTIMFLGLSPIGNLEVGWLSENIGTNWTIRIGAIVVFLFGLLVYTNRKKISAHYAIYQKKSD